MSVPGGTRVSEWRPKLLPYPLVFMKDSLGFVHIQGWVVLGVEGQACFTYPQDTGSLAVN